MNLLPWGGPVARTGVVLNADVNALWQELIPLQGVGLVILMIFAGYMGLVEKTPWRGLVPPHWQKLPSCRMMMKTNPLTMICHLKMQNS